MASFPKKSNNLQKSKRSEKSFEQIPIISILFLSIIAKFPQITGYDILKKIPEIIHTDVIIKSGSLYTQLRRLESSGLVKSNQEKTGRRQRHYVITEDGLKTLKDMSIRMHERLIYVLTPLLQFIEDELDFSSIDVKDIDEIGIDI